MVICRSLAEDGQESANDQIKNHIYSGDSRDRFMEVLDSEWTGPIPHTVLIAPGGKVIYRKTGQIDPLELRRAIVGHLGRTY